MKNNPEPNHFYVIDDDPIFQLTIKKLINLIRPNMDVTVFKNGLDALEFLKIGNQNFTTPSIILLDIHMPVMNGWSFLQAMENVADNNVFSYLDIYLVSCVLYEDDWRRAKKNELIKEFIMKPLSGEKLHSMITNDRK